MKTFIFQGTLCENQHKDGISQFRASTTTASLKNGFCVEIDTGFNSLRDILIQDREDGNPPHGTLNCTCTEEIKIQLNECKICASTFENILYLGPYSTNHIQTSYKNPLAYWVWEMTVNIVATTEWNESKYRSKWLLICHKHKIIEFKHHHFNILPCNLDFLKTAEILKSTIEKMLIGVKH